MEKSRAYQSKLADLMKLGVIAAIINVGLGVHATVSSGMPSGLIIALVFGVVGAVVTWFGSSRADLFVWSGGLIACALLIPTYFHVIPFITALLLVAFACFLAYKAKKG